MNFHIRINTRTEEDILNKKIAFFPIKDFESRIEGEGYNIISATANLTSPHPFLWNISQAYGWDYAALDKSVMECERKKEIITALDFHPYLFLVPQTRNSTKAKLAPEYFITSLLDCINHLKKKRLHFTHFSFIKSSFPKKEISAILSVLLNPLVKTTLENVYWDIDSRHSKEMFMLYRRIAINTYRLNVSQPTITGGDKDFNKWARTNWQGFASYW
jgi:hypothetical protein